MARLAWVLGAVALLLVQGACNSDDRTTDSTTTAATEIKQVSEECAEAFKDAANVNEVQDTHQDLFPAYSACSSIEEWRAADALYPDAFDGVDPVQAAITVCAYNQREIGSTRICRTVNEPSAPTSESLADSGATGLLGVPIPEGSSLAEKTPGDPVTSADPAERYLTSASAIQIREFFEQEMHKRGWAKLGYSDEYALFYRKGNVELSISISSSGDTFRLMGSET